MSDTLVSRYRITFIVFLVLFGFSSVLARLVYLHVLSEPELVQVIADARVREKVLPARRGRIIDSRGNLLAFTRTLWTLGVDPVIGQKATGEEKEKLAEILELPADVVKDAFLEEYRNGRRRRWARIASRVDKDDYEQILELKIPGVYGNPDYVRSYPGGSLAAHIIGFVNREGVGVTGVENVLDFYLRGQSGYREFERDGRRRELAQYRDRQIEPRDGLNVELTLDTMVQHITEEALSSAVERYRPQDATIIVSEPSTGFILALANAPTFDPNEYNEYPVASHRNIAVTDIYEPGSTFKIIPAGAALQESLIKPEDRLDTSLAFVDYRGRRLRLPGEGHIRDEISMRDIVIKSSNRGAAFLGMLLGEDRLYEYCRRFGFGEKTGLGLPGEVTGVLHPVNQWDGLTITRLPMGHAISATPLQVHMAMSVIANGGILMEPKVVRRIFNEDNDTMTVFEPLARRRVLNAEVAATMTKILRETVSRDGTAYRAAIEGFQVAGKTGTTQKLMDGRYSNRHHIASFTGFFPAERPRIVMTVVLDDPTLGNTGYGGVVAAPVFKEVGEQLVRYFGIEAGDERNSSNIAWKGGSLGTAP